MQLSISADQAEDLAVQLSTASGLSTAKKILAVQLSKPREIIIVFVLPTAVEYARVF